MKPEYRSDRQTPASARPRQAELARFGRFVVMSTLAAAMNFGSRIVFSQFVPYPAAIVMAFIVGLSTAFLLNRLFVFEAPQRSTAGQIVWFITVNLFGLVQTLAISLSLAYWLLPALGVDAHMELISHAVGIAAPVLTSYVLHKRLTFRTTASP